MSEQSSKLNRLEQLIQALGQSSSEDDLELTGEEIADVLWLTLKRQEFESQKNIITDSDNANDNDDIEGRKISTPPIQSNIPPRIPPLISTSTAQSTSPPKAPVYSSSSSISSQNLSIGIPDAPSLREPLNLIKSLKLLMQKVPSGITADIDEEATVKRIVEEQIWIPILQEELEPWLDLALVIDESHSMLIWGCTIADLQCIFKQYGIFRELKVWGIKLDETKKKVEFIARNGSNSRIAHPKELVDLTRRRLILIVSDCVSNLWRKGIIFPTLNLWAEKQSLAIVQMLPRFMWRRSALGLGMLVNLSSSSLGVANKDLIPSKIPPSSDATKVPILSLEPERIFGWTEMLVGKRESLVSGYLVPPQLNVNAYPLLVEEQRAIDDQDASQRIERFRKMTSPLGRKLAGLLAASPVISLPIVRLIQQSLLPDSGQVQVAEVFLGGLLKPKSEFVIDANINPETVEYEFIEPEIRDIFIEDAPVIDSTDVLNAVSRYIAEQMGISMREFMAILKSPVAESEQQNKLKPFAEVTVRILKKLGGNYIHLAEEIEGNTLGGKDDNRNEIDQRRLLWQQGKTKIFSLKTNAPWNIPFDAFVISTSFRADFGGSLAASFTNFLNQKSANELRNSRIIALNERKITEIQPESPLIVPLPASVKLMLNFQAIEHELFMICATVKSPQPKVENAGIAVEAVIRLIVQQGLKKVVLSLLGTGRYKLPVFKVAETMLSKIDEILTELPSNPIKEITFVDSSENTIATINKVAEKLQNKIVNYSQLTNFLAAGQWKEADEETAKLIIQASGKKENETLEIKDINNISCRDLTTLDRLWARYSEEHFGFSVQREIYQSLGLTSEYNEKLWKIFCDRLGWRENEKWKKYSEFTFDRKALKGSLPVKWRFSFKVLHHHYMAPNLPISSLIERLIICDVVQPLDVVVAKITFDEEPEAPQQLEFETVTVNSSGQVIKTETHRAFYYEESLAYNIPPLIMMAISEGEFIMGSPKTEPQRYNEESPQHKVKVTPFWLAQTPVTNAQWAFVANLPQIQIELNSKDSNKKNDHPITNVSWYEAMEFCARLSRHTGRDYRLPSEAEWEYACRAGTTTPFHFGATITSELADYNATSIYANEPTGEYRKRTVSVKGFPPNAFGLYDMHGNVWEWCADPWHPNYLNAPQNSLVWDLFNQNNNYYYKIYSHLSKLLRDNRSRILRGGSFSCFPSKCRSAYYHKFGILGKFEDCGFRLACNI
jgi:formylglycine-generating enzyme required for sulfatase activity